MTAKGDVVRFEGVVYVVAATDDRQFHPPTWLMTAELVRPGGGGGTYDVDINKLETLVRADAYRRIMNEH
jgi:hypothetical protein